MADVERYLGEDGKYAWRVKKQVDTSVREVSEEELTQEEEKEINEVLAPKKSKSKKSKK